ncbi:DUF2326 domain-containing protein [Shewanella baltica]|uniref:DUF2326 domain-containing protein n=1 Tax=Shewanella baltica TaxID=62322 RepID=UPI002871BF76|nr:DUF2326 domain-containing protein [Shewanella baltica]MDR9766578.1 DUF2326 domain-containing protein [Shewanella baltica]
MQLINLKVFQDEILIREIKFKDGFNLITNCEDNGNQIGKSTALRVLNFCLGSDGKSIWHDPESRTKNEAVEDLVTSGRVVFSLAIFINEKSYNIKRRIHTVQQKTRTVIKTYSSINDDEFDTNGKFKAALAPILGFSITNPTYSSIKNRFVRLDKKTASNIYRYLNSNTSDQQYILYYSYLFGFSGHNDLASEIQFGEEKSQRNYRISMLLNGRKEQDYKDRLSSIDDEIETLRNKEESFDFKDSQNKGVEKLKNTREEIAHITNEISKLNIRILYSQRTINGYMDKQSNIDGDLIDKIYTEAKLLLPDLKKTLEETIGFHKQVVSKKVNYLSEKIRDYHLSIDSFKKSLNGLLDEEKKLFSALVGEAHLAGFVVIEKEIQDKREERGRTSVIVDEVQHESSEIIILDGKIQDLRERNKLQISQLNQNIAIFNKYLKSFSRAIFRDFSLSFNVGTKSDTNEIEFSIVNQERVSGDGAPRAAALAFDMAFIEFVKETGACFPEFTIQDYLEASDQDKLATLATLANENEIQVVVSVLKEKLASLSQEFIDKNTVLTLKKSDKFFKID